MLKLKMSKFCLNQGPYGQSDAGNPAKNLTPSEGKFAICRPAMEFPTRSKVYPEAGTARWAIP